MTEEQQAAPGRRVKVVYCGGCNPHIDRTAVAAGLAAGLAAESGADSAAGLAAGPGAESATGPAAGLPAAGDPGAGPHATVHLSGCPRACASQHMLSSDDPGTVVVAGELVDGVPTPAPELVPAITRKLKE
jgi:hypothetical protein